MIPTDEQIKEAVLQMPNRNKFSDMPFFRGGIYVRELMKEELNIELAKCECGQEHDIRFMVIDSEGNNVCFECYRSWCSEVHKNVRKLLKVYAEESHDSENKIIESFPKMMELIGKIGEDFTGVGKGWEEY